jgi:hypothetical protein
MSLARRRFALVSAVGLALTVVLAPAVPVAAQQPAPDLPARIDLPDGIQPEGIESDAAGNFYVGSLRDGRIWTGNALTGEESILVEGEPGKVAVGLHLDDLGRLWVAGGPTIQIRVYDVATGDLLETYLFPTAGFINDLDISRNAVYATDSVNQQVLVIPLEDDGGLPDPSAATTMPLTGDLSYSAGFNANGIAARVAGSCSSSRTRACCSRSTREPATRPRSTPAACWSPTATAWSCAARRCTWSRTSTTP